MSMEQKQQEANRLAVAILTAAMTHQAEHEAGNTDSSNTWATQMDILIRDFCSGERGDIAIRLNSLIGLLIGIYIPYCSLLNMHPDDVAREIGDRIMKLE